MHIKLSYRIHVAQSHVDVSYTAILLGHFWFHSSLLDYTPRNPMLRYNLNCMKKKALWSAEKLWDYAVKALAGRAYSTGELRSKLIARAERPADVEQTIARMRDYGYLNDSRFAENYAGAKLDNQGL